MSAQLSRNAQLVKFFAQVYRGVPRVRLVKFIYMADILAREYLGAPISSFEYYRYKYGPYDGAIEDAVRELVDAGLVEDKKDWWEGGHAKRVIDLYQPVPFDFTIGEAAVLGYVVDNYLDMDKDDFIDEVVKQTAPWKAVNRMNQRLPMAEVNDAGTAKVGFKLEEVLRAEQEGKNGDYVTLSEFVDELRAKAPA